MPLLLHFSSSIFFHPINPLSPTNHSIPDSGSALSGSTVYQHLQLHPGLTSPQILFMPQLIIVRCSSRGPRQQLIGFRVPETENILGHWSPYTQSLHPPFHALVVAECLLAEVSCRPPWSEWYQLGEELLHDTLRWPGWGGGRPHPLSRGTHWDVEASAVTE